jgi:hypothetical protein
LVLENGFDIAIESGYPAHHRLTDVISSGGELKTKISLINN